jgi:hypothetical protein
LLGAIIKSDLQQRSSNTASIYVSQFDFYIAVGFLSELQICISVLLQDRRQAAAPQARSLAAPASAWEFHANEN